MIYLDGRGLFLGASIPFIFGGIAIFIDSRDGVIDVAKDLSPDQAFSEGWESLLQAVVFVVIDAFLIRSIRNDYQ